MTTIFDFVSVGLFTGLAILFLHRSSLPQPDPTPLWRYAVAALFCAGGNVAGNHDQIGISALLLACVATFLVATLVRPRAR